MKKQTPSPVSIRIEVELPEGTPASPIFLAGNLPEAGNWEADGLELKRLDSTTAAISLKIPRDANFEFKFTLGSWESVEKDSDHHDIPNRRWSVPENSSRADKHTILCRVESWSDGRESIPHSLTGDIRFHDSFPSKFLKNRRTIAVYLPPGYDTSKKKYPVFYVHDGQNIFDNATSFIGVEWGIDERCEELISEGRIPPMIVVGVYNTSDRVGEYTPSIDNAAADGKTPGDGGRGELYARFLIDEVKPFIDRTYRTIPGREHTSVMGSSLGGLISLYLVWEYSNVFSKAGVISPALWWAEMDLVKKIQKSKKLPKKPFKIWMDVGTLEGDDPTQYIRGFRALTDVFKKKGLERDKDFRALEFDGADHSERAWAARTGMILKYLFSE